MALSSQLAVCRQRVEQEQNPRPRFPPAFRMLWAVLSRVLAGWEDLAQLMKPATVKHGEAQEAPAAIDFFTVTTLNFATVHVFLVLEHGRRRVIHLAVTRGPSTAWVTQQLRNAMPWGSEPKYLWRDDDGIYGHGGSLFLEGCGVREVRTALQSPWQNPYVERFIGTLRRELPSHVIVLNEPHPERLLREFIEEQYHMARSHQGLGGDTPLPTERPPPLDGPATLVATPVLGGLHQRHGRQAA